LAHDALGAGGEAVFQHTWRLVRSFLNTTDTTFTLAGYRYSTSGYYDFQEANEIDPDNFNNWRGTSTKRSKTQLSINQSFGDKGNFYLNGYQQSFWRQNKYERSLTVGYDLSYRSINYGLAYTFTQTPLDTGRNNKDQQLSFKVQFPLGKTLPKETPNKSPSMLKYSLTTCPECVMS
ncbi:fimbria/pilus outer membrane usher protein, partial [Pseudomonas sp. FSL R10-1339]|uniref:fimbria/pilus outer membrane usher protein n=1 Tax=Pseudomonas sp. FSL R10-1339 TaxID=2662196 RepID=UPI001296CBC0